MPKLIDLSQKRFGKLVAIKRVGRDQNKRPLWLCRCDCGTEKVINGSSLRNGDTVSCGCYGREQRIKGHTKHSKTNTRLFNVWQNIKRRCYTKSNPSYKYYGALGVTVCDEWLKDFEAFRDWAYSNGYDESAPKGECTIDRINPFGNYEPDNCRWVSMKVQNLNRKANRIIKYGNESHTLVEWAEKLNINYSTLLYRFRRGWSVEKAFNAEVKNAK